MQLDACMKFCFCFHYIPNARMSRCAKDLGIVPSASDPFLFVHLGICIMMSVLQALLVWVPEVAKWSMNALPDFLSFMYHLNQEPWTSHWQYTSSTHSHRALSVVIKYVVRWCIGLAYIYHRVGNYCVRIVPLHLLHVGDRRAALPRFHQTSPQSVTRRLL